MNQNDELSYNFFYGTLDLSFDGFLNLLFSDCKGHGRGSVCGGSTDKKSKDGKLHGGGEMKR